ncbi:MAG: NAD-dependent epimerase/dehydratase family protein [candidate division Zixibacteria bacterium]|nr:NAD-dependent epimerase/dehydratase family protein [candidate division Zixibacteria bacterium]
MPTRPAVFITGANGFVGSHLARALDQAGYPIRALVRKGADRTRVANVNIEWIEGDLNDREALAQGCKDAGLIFHVAGRVKAPDLAAYRMANVQGTINLLDAAEGSRSTLQRFVYVSSLAAAGPARDGHAKSEIDPESPTTPYGISKLEGELAVRKRADRMPVTVVRPPAVYGPGDTEVLGFFQAVNWHIKPLFKNPPVRMTMVHITDLVDGILLAAEKPEAVGEVFFIAENQHYDLATAEDLIQAALGTWAVRVRIPGPLLLTIAGIAELVGKVGGFTPKLNRHKARDFMQNDWTCSIEKAMSRLGYQSRIPFAEGTKQTVEWYRANGWL